MVSPCGPMESYGIPMGCPWGAQWVPMGHPMLYPIGCPIGPTNFHASFFPFSLGAPPPRPPEKSASGLPRRVRNSWYHGTMVPWYHGSVVGMVPMAPMVHVVAWYRGTMVPMVWGYQWYEVPFDMILCFFLYFYKDGSVRIPDGK